MSSAATIPRPSSDNVLLSVQGLTKRFPVQRDLLGRPVKWLAAVDGVSLEIKKGETLGLVGESGSGKSTLARVILRLLPATSGSVIFDGQDVLRASPSRLRAFREQAQIVFQDPFGSLDPRMKVSALISEGMSHLHLSGVDRRKRLAELLDLVHLPTGAMERYPHEFSGGQKQRISIARALAVDPQFIVADEPVSALDVSMQSQILNLMRELQTRLGLTYLFITHDMSVVRYMADRVAVMYYGKIVETAAADQLFAQPNDRYTQTLLSSVPSLLKGELPKRPHSRSRPA
jgi:ABC-type oligopeptide transport system ATPase subunit